MSDSQGLERFEYLHKSRPWACDLDRMRSAMQTVLLLGLMVPGKVVVLVPQGKKIELDTGSDQVNTPEPKHKKGAGLGFARCSAVAQHPHCVILRIAVENGANYWISQPVIRKSRQIATFSPSLIGYWGVPTQWKRDLCWADVLANFLHKLLFSSTACRPSLPECPNSPHCRPRACDVAEFWVVTPSFSTSKSVKGRGRDILLLLFTPTRRPRKMQG